VRTTSILLLGFAVAFAAGCQSTQSCLPLEEQITALNKKNKQLANQLEQANAANKQLNKQIQVLSGLPEGAKPQELYGLQSVKIGQYTNLYDKDKDGKKEKLIVYIQPIDHDGDAVKAIGAVDVQLLDLNKEPDQALLGEWHIKPGELQKLWFAGLISTNFRLTFDIADKLDKFETPLTVKVTFTDYLTGKAFWPQKVIKP